MRLTRRARHASTIYGRASTSTVSTIARPKPRSTQRFACWPAEAQESRDFATVLFDAARLKTFSGDHPGARPLAERGCALAERLGDAGLQARALIELEVHRRRRGSP